MEPLSAPSVDTVSSKNEIPEFDAFKSVLLYSAYILFLPIAAFFVSKFFVFDGMYASNLVTSNVWSAITAIIVLHISLGFYIYKAYIGPEKSTKKD